MNVAALFKVKNPEIRALHLTWIAFFLTFFVWFNMAPLATTMMEKLHWLTESDVKLLLICNVALTIPARIFVGMALDRWGPRRVYSILMVGMGLPALAFAFGDSMTQMLITRLLCSCVGAGFVIGIHMTALWFKPKDIGFAEGFYGGWGNFGAAGAAMLMPVIAFDLWGGENGWRYALASSALIMMAYGVFYWFAVTDGPTGSVVRKPRKSAAMEVSSWPDMYKLIATTVVMFGILSALVWKIEKLGYLSGRGAWIAHAAVWSLVIYKVIQIVRVNVPILRAGVPDDDRYNFDSVAALNTTYFANFGAELALVSMLPLYFYQTFHGSDPWVSKAVAGVIAGAFPFVNLVSRPFGGMLSDWLKNRKRVMLIYMAGIAVSWALMGLFASWSVWAALTITVLGAIFIQGGAGATYAIVPHVKRRITGQVAGMAGAYGNVGGVFYLTVLTFVDNTTFFYVIAAGGLASFLFCLLFLKEPHAAHADEYQVSSVDQKIHAEQAAAAGAIFEVAAH